MAVPPDAAAVRIGLVGDRDDAVAAHRAIPLALELAGAQAAVPVAAGWIGTELVGRGAALAGLHGIWLVPASPYRSFDGALTAVKLARTGPVPFLGTCGGFQHALVEFARSVLGRPDAEHSESRPDAEDRIIVPLACALPGVAGGVRFRAGSRLRGIYGSDHAEETYQCSYGLDPAARKDCEAAGLPIVAEDESGSPRAFELRGHPFFFGTLFQPERAALAGRAHPLVRAFVEAAASARDRER